MRRLPRARETHFPRPPGPRLSGELTALAWCLVDQGMEGGIDCRSLGWAPPTPQGYHLTKWTLLRGWLT